MEREKERVSTPTNMEISTSEVGRMTCLTEVDTTSSREERDTRVNSKKIGKFKFLTRFRKEGVGTYHYLNGNIYEGQWSRDKKHGKGTYTYYLTNEKYEGEFYENEKRGRGVFTYRFGDRYEGEFYANEKSGKGTIYYKSGARFEGVWEKVNLNFEVEC
jgi:hypothetical protein